MRPLRAVSLFSNCGAGDVGFRRAGFRFDVLAEIDARRISVAKLNHPEADTIVGDISVTWTRVIKAYRERAGNARPALLSACPPCQGMSSAKHDRGSEKDADAGGRDSRNLLVLPIAKVANALEPRMIVVENVPAFLTRLVRDPRTRKAKSAALLLIDALSAKYEVFPIVGNLADYGVPQDRKRSFLTFIHRDERCLRFLMNRNASPYPKPTRGSGIPHITIVQALKKAKVSKLDASGAEVARDPRRPLHFVPVFDERRYSMVAAIPKNSGLSAWQNSRCPTCQANESQDVAKCLSCGTTLLRPIVFQANGAPRLVRGFRWSSYRRIRPYRPAPTITTASGNLGSAFTIHPSENRILSILECAILQTFPASFNWGDALQRYGSGLVRKMIGEAVPPLFTERHGAILIDLLRTGRSARTLSAADVRRCRANRALGAAAFS